MSGAYTGQEQRNQAAIVTSRSPATALLALALLLITGCTSRPITAPDAAARSTVCENYLVYNMCVRDVDRDGSADLMYFADTNEIFMVTPEFRDTHLPDLSDHRCMQVMDEPLQDTSSRILHLDRDAGTLQKTRLKSQLMLEYLRYAKAINSCMDGSAVAGHAPAADNFGDEDFNEL